MGKHDQEVPCEDQDQASWALALDKVERRRSREGIRFAGKVAAECWRRFASSPEVRFLFWLATVATGIAVSMVICRYIEKLGGRAVARQVNTTGIVCLVVLLAVGLASVVAEEVRLVAEEMRGREGEE